MISQLEEWLPQALAVMLLVTVVIGKLPHSLISKYNLYYNLWVLMCFRHIEKWLISSCFVFVMNTLDNENLRSPNPYVISRSLMLCFLTWAKITNLCNWDESCITDTILWVCTLDWGERPKLAAHSSHYPLPSDCEAMWPAASSCWCLDYPSLRGCTFNMWTRKKKTTFFFTLLCQHILSQQQGN